LSGACTADTNIENSSTSQREDPTTAGKVATLEISEIATVEMFSEASTYPTKSNPEQISKDTTNLVGETPPSQIIEDNSASTESILFVIDQSESNVIYGVGETFLNQNNRYNYAQGVTNIVSGEILVNFTEPSLSSVGEITIDIKSFKSDKSRRDNAIRDRWLESNKFPMAVFTPNELRGLPEKYTLGDTVDIEIDGNLLVRDTIKPVSFLVTLTINNDQMVGQASTQLKMTDFGFDPPDISGILKAENEVDITFEFLAHTVSSN
jgi:polyisoprenoid-binding protein YceI